MNIKPLCDIDTKNPYNSSFDTSIINVVIIHKVTGHCFVINRSTMPHFQPDRPMKVLMPHILLHFYPHISTHLDRKNSVLFYRQFL